MGATSSISENKNMIFFAVLCFVGFIFLKPKKIRKGTRLEANVYQSQPYTRVPKNIPNINGSVLRFLAYLSGTVVGKLFFNPLIRKIMKFSRLDNLIIMEEATFIPYVEPPHTDVKYSKTAQVQFVNDFAVQNLKSIGDDLEEKLKQFSFEK